MTGLTRAESTVYAQEVLVMPSWPRGWCPIHTFEAQQRCSYACWRARVEGARAAHDLEQYFNSLYGLGWHRRESVQ